MYLALSLLLVMTIAALNLYLGFATAVYVRGADTAKTPVDYLWFLVNRQALSFESFRRAPAVEAAAICAPVPADQANETSESAAQDHEESETESAPLEEDAEAETHPVELTLQRITTDMHELGKELAQLDAKLREAIVARDGDALRNCAAALSVSVHAALDRLGQTVDLLTGYEPQSPDFESARSVVDNLCATLAAEMNAALSHLVGLSFDDPTEGLFQQLIDAHDKVASATHGHRDRLVEALLVMVHCELGLENMSRHLRGDQQTGLAARAGFETALAEWRQNEDAGDKKSYVAMFDIDQLAVVNSLRGVEIGDRVLAAIAGQLRRAVPDGHVAARAAGQQFVLLCPDTDDKSTIEIAERIRQTIEQTTFRSSSGEIQVTLSAAVVEVADDDEIDHLLGRLRSTVREAKSYGRNRTFLCEDDIPTPVVPMELSITPAATAI